MLEFVLVLPVFALILFMVLDYGWLFINYIEVSNTSRNAARIACVEYETVNLENGAVVSPKSYTLDDLDDDDINDETKDIIRQVKNSLPKNVDNVKIKVSYSNDIEAEIAAGWWLPHLRCQTLPPRPTSRVSSRPSAVFFA